LRELPHWRPTSGASKGRLTNEAGARSMSEPEALHKRRGLLLERTSRKFLEVSGSFGKFWEVLGSWEKARVEQEQHEPKREEQNQCSQRTAQSQASGPAVRQAAVRRQPTATGDPPILR
jgi:hypothetical protein